ncbi:MAG TPA: site-specific integrase, partial [Burkholderiales bacterium]|nr:site-specific integrase [Burkholderiales bacterium]
RAHASPPLKPGPWITATAVQYAANDELQELQKQAMRFFQEARASRTRMAYDHDWRLFERWCQRHGQLPLPASASLLALYLTHMAQLGRKASTIRRARIAIGQVHGAAGLPRPDQNDRIRSVERGIGRSLGTHEESAAPISVDDLERMVRPLQRNSVRDDRDRALLLLGFAGAFRASDLVVLDVEHISFGDSVLIVHVPRSKEDQMARGRVTQIPFAANPNLCAAGALRRWMERVGRDGPLFRVVHGGRVEHQRIHPRTVSRAVQRAATRVGIEQKYSAHSLRSGLATAAFAQGATDRDIQMHGRWKDLRSLDRYIRLAAIPNRRNVVTGLL